MTRTAASFAEEEARANGNAQDRRQAGILVRSCKGKRKGDTSRSSDLLETETSQKRLKGGNAPRAPLSSPGSPPTDADGGKAEAQPGLRRSSRGRVSQEALNVSFEKTRQTKTKQTKSKTSPQKRTTIPGNKRNANKRLGLGPNPKKQKPTAKPTAKASPRKHGRKRAASASARADGLEDQKLTIVAGAEPIHIDEEVFATEGVEAEEVIEAIVQSAYRRWCRNNISNLATKLTLLLGSVDATRGEGASPYRP